MDMTSFLAESWFRDVLLSVGVIVLALVLKKVLYAILQRQKDLQRQFGTKNAVSISLYAATTICLFFIWFEGFGSFMTILAVVAAALTIVCKELLLNFVSSFIILWRELFSIGDRIHIQNFSGDVTEKGVFYFTLLEVNPRTKGGQSTGRVVKVPNHLALVSPMVNASKGFEYIWNEFSITVSPDSLKTGVSAARKTLENALKEYEAQSKIDFKKLEKKMHEHFIMYRNLTPKVYMRITEHGVMLSARYICHSRGHRDSEQFLSERVLEAVNKGEFALWFDE